MSGINETTLLGQDRKGRPMLLLLCTMFVGYLCISIADGQREGTDRGHGWRQFLRNRDTLCRELCCVATRAAIGRIVHTTREGARRPTEARQQHEHIGSMGVYAGGGVR